MAASFNIAPTEFPFGFGGRLYSFGRCPQGQQGKWGVGDSKWLLHYGRLVFHVKSMFCSLGSQHMESCCGSVPAISWCFFWFRLFPEGKSQRCALRTQSKVADELVQANVRHVCAYSGVSWASAKLVNSLGEPDLEPALARVSLS